ncbi:MAG: nucleoside kinase [Lachnospiraceae bacterium]|nr:nucleoside kinase [Lachnospiraceae bacterium]
MEQRQVTVKIGAEQRSYPAGTPLLTIAREYQAEQEADIVLAKENGKLRELFRTVCKDCELSFVTTASGEGFEAYRRSMTLLMLKAFYHEAGHENIRRVGIHFSVSSGYYCTVDGNVNPDAAFLERVSSYMREMVEQRIPIAKETIGTDEAMALFSEYGMKDKEKLFHYRRASKVNLYNLDGFEDYYYGYMVPDTSYLKYFALYPYEDGFVLQMPRRENPKEVPPFEPETKIFHVRKESLKWGEMLEIPTVGALNDYIVQHGIHDLILIQEALQEKKIAEIAEQIATNPDRKIVMIAGPSSSGKTTFSHRLSIQLSAHGLKPHPIPVDNYFVNREDTPMDEDGKPNYECLEAIDTRQFNQDMNALLAGEEILLPVFNFVSGKREYKGVPSRLGQDDILVIEGIHCLNDQLSYSLPKENKFKIYISALTQLNIDEHNRVPATDGRLLRRIVRDSRTRGTNAKATISMWPSVRRGEESYIFPYQEEADVMFNSALIYELAVLKMYAEPQLFGIGKDEPEYQEAKRLLKFLDYFVGIPSENVPMNSLLREFIGGGCFLL